MMSEIDVSKCEYKYKDSCNLYENKCKYITDCHYRQLQQLKAENEELREKLKEVQKFLERYEVGECNWDDDCYYCKNASKDGEYFCSIGNALEVIRGEK